MKVALDNQVPEKFIYSLKQQGFSVVIRAYDEPDEEWVAEGLDGGAMVFVSPDLDIPNLIEKTEAIWIDYNCCRKNPLDTLLKKLRTAKKYFEILEQVRRING